MNNKLPHIRHTVSMVWGWLIEPAASLRDPEEVRLSKLLAACLVLVLPVIILVGMIVMPLVSRAPAFWQAPTFLPASIASIISLLSYAINRLGKHRLAARLYIFVFIFSPWLAVYQDSRQVNLPIAILMLGGVLMASILIPDGWSMFAAALGTVVGILLLPVIKEGVTLADIAAVLSVIVTLNLLIIILTYYRNRLEQERQLQLRAENINLHESSEYNDKRVSELIDTIVAMSSLDFSKRAPIGERGDMYDAVATGINALSEELENGVISRAELEQMVNLRTQQLEEVNAELTNFAYVTSHDLKAPLRAISQLSAWIVEDYAPLLDQDGRDKLALLTDRAKHMHNLIDGILQYSRVGRASEKVVEIDLNSLVQKTMDVLSPPPHVKVQIEGRLPVVKAEPTYIAQVFQNLLANAINYMDKPHGYISIKCEEDDANWVFGVADNGPGIEQKYFAKIFQMFQTLGPRKDVDSTGIGLALVKRIVEKWGGKIWLESTVGQGTIFYFTIPINGGGHERK